MKTQELLVIWHKPKCRRHVIGHLRYDGNTYFFTYNPEGVATAQADGFSFFPGFSELDKTYTSDTLFANIKTRLPDPARPDYLDLLNRYGVTKNSTDWETLQATRGRLLTDNFEFIPVFDPSAGKLEFDVAGVRHRNPSVCDFAPELHENTPLRLVCEPENQSDPNAVKVIFQRKQDEIHLGYVPSYYANDLSKMLAKNVKYSAMISRIDLDASHNDEKMRVAVRMIFDAA